MNILYTTHCPKCKILEKKLQEANIEYSICDNETEIIDLGFETVPVLQTKDAFLGFGEAVKYINSLEGRK